MKYFIILLTLVTITSCVENSHETKGGDIVNQIQFKGHEYISFHSYYARGYVVMHDPDCKCKKGGEK